MLSTPKITQGGLQFLTRSSTLSLPFYKTRPTTLPASLPDVQLMAVDILPASLPFDASNHFSEVLLPYLTSLINSYNSEEFECKEDQDRDEYTRALCRATIASGGKLARKHEWLQDSVDKYQAELLNSRSPLVGSQNAKATPVSNNTVLRRKNLLMLGSGMVADPAVEEILKRPDVQLVIGIVVVS